MAMIKSKFPRQMMRHQRGVVVFVALIALVIMLMTGLALIRSVDTGTSISGSLSFRQNSLQIADIATEQAVTFIQNAINLGGIGALDNDQSANGYVASKGLDFVPNVSTRWNDSAGVPVTPRVAALPAPFNDGSYTVTYIIHRLCNSQGSSILQGTNCLLYTASATANVQGVAQCANCPGSTSGSTSSPQYRITARVQGPKNVVSYVQTMVH